MKLVYLLVHSILLLTPLAANATTICTSRSWRKDCTNPTQFFDEYRQQSCSRHHLADAIEANWQFILDDTTGIKEMFHPSLNTGDKNVNCAVKSLIELHQSIERFISTNNQPEVAQILAVAMAKDLCKWLSEVGILDSADCDNSDSYLPQLMEVSARIDLLDAMSNSRSAIRKLPSPTSYSYKVHYCAWINDRILGNCQDASNYNGTYREVLSPICSDECLGRIDGPDISLCRM